MGPVIDLLISLTLIYFLLSTIVGSLVEVYNSYVGKNSRSTHLYKALLKVFNDRQNKNWTDLLYRHPLIESSKRNLRSLPTYIDPKIFSTAIVDIFARESKEVKVSYEGDMPVIDEDDISPKDAFEAFQNGVNQIKNSDVKTLLQSLLLEARDISTLKISIQNWYNGYMDRVGGWYKRKTRRKLFWAALFVTIILNVDSIRLVTTLYRDDTLRNQLIEQAIAISSNSSLKDTYVSRPSIDSLQKSQLDTIGGVDYGIDSLIQDPKDEKSNAVADTLRNPCSDKIGEELRQCIFEQNIQKAHETYVNLKLAGVPIGWETDIEADGFWTTNWRKYASVQLLFGWLISTLVLMQGAPFWFNVLSGLINIRGSGAKPKTDKNPDKPS